MEALELKATCQGKKLRNKDRKVTKMVIVIDCLVPIGYRRIPVVTTPIAFIRKFVLL